MGFSVYHILLAFVINRIVENIKQGLPPEDSNKAIDRWRTALILFLSFVIGSITMLLVFPNDNLFPTASSQTAGLVFTGILVGGVANGWDLAGKFGDAAVERVKVSTAKVLAFNASVEAQQAA